MEETTFEEYNLITPFQRVWNEIVGDKVGKSVGMTEILGVKVGERETIPGLLELNEGGLVGERDGVLEGVLVGVRDGVDVGLVVGNGDGTPVGWPVGSSLGFNVGEFDGLSVGKVDGM